MTVLGVLQSHACMYGSTIGHPLKQNYGRMTITVEEPIALAL